MPIAGNNDKSEGRKKEMAPQTIRDVFSIIGVKQPVR